MNEPSHICFIIFFAKDDSFRKSNKSVFKRHLRLPLMPSLQPLNLYNYTALVKSRTSFMFESLMMYFLLGLWLFITVSN